MPDAASDLELDERTEGTEELRADIARAHRLDRDLADHMGRRAPVRSAVARTYIEELGRRPQLSEVDERRLVLAAQRGDHAARARLVEVFMPLVSAIARTYRSGQVQRLELRRASSGSCARSSASIPSAACRSGAKRRGGSAVPSPTCGRLRSPRTVS